MLEEYEKRKRKQISLMRSVFDYGMGILFVCVGAFLFFRGYINTPLNERFPPDKTDKLFGAICFIYGAWRIYRGVKKNYFR